jgi:hypothetical protein
VRGRVRRISERFPSAGIWTCAYAVGPASRLMATATPAAVIELTRALQSEGKRASDDSW